MRQRPILLKFYIFVTFMFALILSVIPMPQYFNDLRPAWVALILIFWSIYVPESFGLITVWLIGLIEDSIHLSLLGEHALGLLIIFYLVNKMHYQLIASPLWSQTLRVGFLVILNQLIIGAIQGIIGQGFENNKLFNLVWSTTFVSLLVWPWLSLMMRELIARYGLRLSKFR